MAVTVHEVKLLLEARDRMSAVAEKAVAAAARAVDQANKLGQNKGFQQASQSVDKYTISIKNAGSETDKAVTRITAKMREAGAESAKLATANANRLRAETAAQREALRFAQEAERARTKATQSQNVGRGRGAAGTGDAGNAAALAFQRAGAAAKQASSTALSGFGQVASLMRSLAGGVGSGIFSGFTTAISGLVRSAGGLASVGSAITNLGRSASSLSPASTHVNSLTSSLTNMIGLGASITGFGSLITAVGTGFRTFADAAIGFNAQLERTRIAFTTLLGSADQADIFMQQLRDFAESTTFEFPEVLKLSQGLLGVGFAADRILPMLQQVAGAMTAAGRTSADMAGVGRALQQIATTGRVQGDEMNQLAERGIPAWRILGEAIRKDGEELDSAIARARKLGEQGQISSRDFFAAFQRYASQNKWADLATGAVQSFTGAVSNIKDSFRFLVSDAAKPAFDALSAGLQNLSNQLRGTEVRQLGLDIGATLREAMSQVQSFATAAQAAFSQAFSLSKLGGAGDLQATLQGMIASIVSAFTQMGVDMQSAGAQLMVEYANGIVQGASDVIQSAVQLVADLIASFLIGQSPPPDGPLSQIGQGGANTARAWVEGFSSGFGDLSSIIQSVADEFGNIGKNVSLTDVQAAFKDAAGNIAAMREVGEDAEGVLRNLSGAIRDLNEEQAEISFNIDDIKAAYGDQITDLERAIEATKEQNTYAEEHAKLIQMQNDAISRQADLRDKIAENELRAARIAAEGDPVKKAELIAEETRLKFREDELALAQKEQDLARSADQASEKQVKYAEDLAKWEENRAKAKKDGKEFDTRRPKPPDPKDQGIARARLALDREQLENKRRQLALVDKERLAEIAREQALLDYGKAQREIEETRKRAATDQVISAAEIERATKNLAALPLEEQVKELKKEQERLLDPLEKQLNTLQRQEKVLQMQQQRWQGLKQDIANAVAEQTKAESDAKKAAKAASGSGGPTLFAPEGFEFESQPLVDKGKQIGQSMVQGIRDYIVTNAGTIIFGAIGGVLGANLFGPLGFAAGTAFGTQVGVAVQAKVPQLTTIVQDAGRTFLQAFAGEWSTEHGGEWVSPIVDAAGRLGIIMRQTADTIGSVWNALKGPITSFTATVRENFGLIAAASTGLLVPAFVGASKTILGSFSPILSLLGRVSPAMLLVGGAAVTLKAMWDSNFGGIRDTTAAAMPQIQGSLGILKAALLELAGGNTKTALLGFQIGLSELGKAVGPILSGVGSEISRQLPIWAEKFKEWAPGALAALGQAGAQILQWFIDNGPTWAQPALRALQDIGPEISKAVDGIIVSIGQIAGVDLDPLNGKLDNLGTLFATLATRAEEEMGKIRQLFATEGFKSNIQTMLDSLQRSFEILKDIGTQTIKDIANMVFDPMGSSAGSAAEKIKSLADAMMLLSRGGATWAIWIEHILDNLNTLGKFLDNLQGALNKFGLALHEFAQGQVKLLQGDAVGALKHFVAGAEFSKQSKAFLDAIAREDAELRERAAARKEALDKINADTEAFFNRQAEIQARSGDKKISDPRDAVGWTGPPIPKPDAIITPDVIQAIEERSRAAGAAIPDGMEQGILEGVPATQQQMDQFNNGLSELIERHWGIRSPSTLAISYGVAIVEGFAEGITTRAQDIVAAFVQIATDSQSAVETWMAQMLALVTTGMQNIWNQIQTDGAAVVGAVQIIWDESLVITTTTWQTIWNATMEGMQSVWGAITNLGPDLIGAIEEIMTGVMTAFSDGWQSAWQSTMDGLTAIHGAVMNLMPAITGAVKLTLDGIKNMMSDWSATGASLGKALMDAVISAIQSGMGALGNLASGSGLTNMSFNGGSGALDINKIAQTPFSINASAGRDEVLKQWAPVLRAIEQSGGPLARNIAAIILAENGGGNSDLVRNSKNWFSISASAERRAKGLQSGVDAGGRFASYTSDSQALADFLDLISTLPRYTDAWAARMKSTEEFIGGLVPHGNGKGGYMVPEPGYPVENWVRNTAAGARTFDQVAANIPAMSVAVQKGVTAAMNTAGRIPVVQNALSSSYWTSGGTHGGSPAADIFAPKGSPIYAPVSGESMPAKYALGGEATIIKGDDGKFYYMAHGNVPFTGGRVAAGQQIGEVGNTGNAAGTSPHLHYAIATAMEIFDRLNGSGNISGSPDDWRTSGALPSVPVMGAGGKGPKVNEDWPAIVTRLDEAVPDFLTDLNQIQAASQTSFEAAAQASENAGARLVSSSTDSLGNVTRIYSESGGVIGATITDASGQIVNAWGSMATSIQPATDAVATGAQTIAQNGTELAETLMQGVAPAGATAGTALQQMTANINPLLSQIAAGTITTEDLVATLAQMASTAGLTNEPLLNLQAGSTELNTAMIQLLQAAGAIDPQFLTLADSLRTTNADAQTMAVTFAEGVANGVGNAQAALQQMQGVIDPVIAKVADGSLAGEELERTIVSLASSTGLATAPFRDLQNGVTDSAGAFKAVLREAAKVSPEFEELFKQVEASGAVSDESRKKFLELVAAFKAAQKPAEDAGKGAEEAGKGAQEAAQPFDELNTTITTQAASALESYQSTMTEGTRAAIENVRALAPDAEAAGTEIGSALTRGLESGISSAAESVANKAAEVVRKAIDAAREEANAHSPSEETRELGWNMNAGLEIGQIEDASYVEDAARGVVAMALDAMRDEADAHSPSGEGVKIGKDIMDGLIKGLRSGNLDQVARDQINEYIKIAGDFSDSFAKQVEVGVARLQHQIAGAQRENLDATLAVADAQAAIERAGQGTLAQRREMAKLGVQEAAIRKQMASHAMDDLEVQNRLRDAEQARERLAAGSLDSQRQVAQIGQQSAQIAAQQAVAAQQSLGVRQQLAVVEQQLSKSEADRAKALKGSLADQTRLAEIAGRTAQITLQQAQAEKDMLPLRVQTRELQQEIERTTKGTVEAQQAAIRAEADAAAKKIEQLQIQDKLALGEDTGGGMSQDEINSLNERNRALEQEAASNARQLEIERLQKTIATAANREQLVALQDQLSTREDALEPLADEKAMLDAESQVINANNAVLATAYDQQIIQLQAQQSTLQEQVAQHDAIALALQQQQEALDAQLAVVTTMNEAQAAGMDVLLVDLQAAADQVAARQQGEQDALDKIAAQKGVIESTIALQVAGLQDTLVLAEENLYVQQATQRSLERQLEIQEATAGVISTQIALANALKAALEFAGVIGDDDNKKKKKKKKRAAGGPIYEDDIVLVGEGGPEIIVAPDDGYVLNNATTTRLMSIMDAVDGTVTRASSTVRARQAGGVAWRGRSYLSGESGVEGFTTTSASMQAPMRAQNVYYVNVEYHSHQPVMGEARVDRVVTEAVQFAQNAG